MSERKATIYDIAKKTGCSPATVSRAINHPEQVGSVTLDAIREAMADESFRKRGYRMPGGRDRVLTGSYLLSIPSPGNPFYGQIIEGAAAAAAAHNCRILISYSMYLERSASGISFSENLNLFDGLIIMSGIDDRELAGLSERIPLIQCSEYSEETDTVSCVSIDDAASIRKSVDYLVSTGHRYPAYISCPTQMRYARRRLRGFRSACEASGITVPDSAVIILPQTGFDVAHSAALRLLSASPRPDAIICSSDIYAIACLKAALELGIRIPEELSVVGFDDIPQASMTQLALTTIRQPRYQLGYTAFETLYREIQEPGVHKQRIFLPTELIIRETTGMRRPL